MKKLRELLPIDSDIAIESIHSDSSVSNLILFSFV